MDIFQYTVNFLTVPMVILLVLLVTQGQWAGKFTISIANLFRSRALFQTSEMPGDQIVLNAARILMASILLYRLFQIGAFAIPLGLTDVQVFALWAYVGLLVALLIGLATPLAALLLLLFQLHFNYALKTYTLGVDVTAMLLLCFVLYPVGQYFSVDNLLAKHSSLIRQLYRWFSFSDRATQVTLAKALPFLSYYLLCLYSVLGHVAEPLWMNGEAAIHLLSSSYLSRFSDFFQLLFSSSALAVWAAKASMVGMVAWYFLLFPAVLVGGVLRAITIIWAILFFILSAVVLQLSALPYIEFLILIVWFWDQYRVAGARSFNMLYDDRCNLCDRTVRTVRILDIQNVIHYLPVSNNQHESERLGIAPELLTRDLYSWDTESGKVFSGYDFYLHLSRKVLVLIPFYPILLFFKLIGIGPMVYRKVADFRIRLFGVCALPTDTDAQISSNLEFANGARHRFGLFAPLVITNIVMAVVLLAVMPTSPLVDYVSKNHPNLVRSAHIFSWSKINVFNRSDLGLSHHYFTVHIEEGERRTLLPFTDKSGGRLDWHKSDVVYFGNSLRWRRLKNNEELLPVSSHDLEIFCNIITWAGVMDISGEGHFIFDFYKSEWPTEAHGMFKFGAPVWVGQRILTSGDCQQ